LTLAGRVLVQEHRIYPLAIRWFAEGRLRLEDGAVWFDGQPLEAPLVIDGTADAV
jgi:phosphoribosylglycinamide formyltransferase-1